MFVKEIHKNQYFTVITRAGGGGKSYGSLVKVNIQENLHSLNAVLPRQEVKSSQQNTGSNNALKKKKEENNP